MQKRRTLFSAVIAALSVALLVASAEAAFSASITYSKFNSGSWTYYDMGTSYSSFVTNVTNRLTYNTTTNQWAKVAFLNSSSGTATGIVLTFKKASNALEVYSLENTVLGAADILIGTGTWDENNTKVTLSGSKLNVWDANGLLVSDFVISEPVRYLGVVGGPYYVQGGYLSVGVNAGLAGATATVTEFIPVIVTFAMLGMVLGMLKKFGKI